MEPCSLHQPVSGVWAVWSPNCLCMAHVWPSALNLSAHLLSPLLQVTDWNVQHSHDTAFPRSSVQIHWREHGGMLRVRHLPSIQLLRPCPSLRQKERDRERWRGRKREEHLSCSSSKSGRKSRGTLKWRIFWGKSACFAEDPLCWNHNQMEYELPNRNECMSAIFSNLSDFRAHPLIPPDRQIKSSLHPGRNLNHAGTLMYKNSSEAQPQRQIRPMVKINQQEKARFTEVL